MVLNSSGIRDTASVVPMTKNEQKPEFTTAQALSQYPSGKLIVSSVGLSWNGLSVYSEKCPPPPDITSELSVPSHQIILNVADTTHVERRLDGERWLSSPSHPGLLTFVPAHRSPQWLWDAEVELLNISLPPSLIESVALESFDFAPQSVELIDRFAIRDPLIEQLALALKAKLERPSQGGRLYLESVQNMLAAHLLCHHCSVEVASPALPSGLPKYKLRQTIDYIQDNLGDDIGLTELAGVVQMSPHHFSKLFKQSTGMPPHQYVLMCRVERAKELLVDKQLSLAQVSQQLGFYDQSHFTTVFRRATALTPRQYRKSL